MFGTVLVIGGAAGLVGAALLAGRAALKLGAGSVHVALLAENAPGVDMAQPELMLHQAADAMDLLPLPHAEARKPAKAARHPVVAIGCGMGDSLPAQRTLLEVMGSAAPLVLDADALNLLADDPDLRDVLRARDAAAVITPHPGEAARLLGITVAEVQADRVGAARRLAETLRCTVALKGAHTVCITREGKTHVNQTGNPGMSAPGMGDALAGMLAAFLAQGLDPDRATLLAVYLHGAAGDALASEGIGAGMTASEVTDRARRLLNGLTAGQATAR